MSIGTVFITSFDNVLNKNIFINILREWNSASSILTEIDSTYCKVHQHATDARKIYGNQGMGVSRSGKNSKIHALINDKMKKMKQYTH